jgi:cyclohexyl-isocyanide hydratase
MNVEVHLLWKTLEPVDGGKSLKIMPTTRLSDCPRDLDVLFVPGGTPGTSALLEDDTVLDFLADRGSRAKYVTSVCTGSLVLGGAGLLKGYRATSHWNYRDVLPVFGAIPVKQRIVEDRNRITGGGVTSGIDFGLVIASRMRGERYARMMQLALEYDPHPPFVGGTPDAAGPALTHEMQYMMSIGHSDTRQAAVGAVTRRKLG